MRIRKKEPSVGIIGKIVNSFTNSKQDTYSADYLNQTLDEKSNSKDVYTKTEVDTALGKKANTSITYTKEEVDTALNKKANTSTTYTKTEVNNKIKGIKLTYGLISGLQLGPDATYQIDLPANAIWVEPLLWGNAVADDGGGGILVPIGGGYVYATGSDHIDSENQHRGVWCRCTRSGSFQISNYRHCGRNVVGLRVWYLDLE